MEKLAEGYGLVEGPVWVPGRGLLFSDVLFGGVYSLGADGGVSEVFAHRRGIGGMALHEDGGLIVSGRNVSYKPFDGGATVTVLDRDEAAGNIGYNDLTTDSEGRVYAGSLGASPVFDDGREPRAGELYLIDLDGSARAVGTDVQLTNGLGFSPDASLLYHCDSARQTVFRYSVLGDGTLGEKRPFVETARGAPDGLAVSEDGAVWVALAGGSGVGVYSPSGEERDFIGIGQPMCTSLCFGGPASTICISFPVPKAAPATRPGPSTETRAGVAGLPVPAARVRIA